MADLLHLAREAAYVTVGAGVLVFQRLQVERRAFEKRLWAQAGEALEAADRLTRGFDEQVEALERRLRALEGRAERPLDRPEQAPTG